MVNFHPSVTTSHLADWYFNTESGTRFSLKIQQHLQQFSQIYMPDSGIQLGPMRNLNWLEALDLNQRLSITSSDSLEPGQLCAMPYQLPIQQDSIDVALLPHLFELLESNYVHSVLAEVFRVLSPEGHLIYVGLNPNTLPVLLKGLIGKQSNPQVPATVGVGKLYTWLNASDFFTIKAFYIHDCYITGLVNPKYKIFFDQLTHMVCPDFGKIYIIVAKKRMHNLRSLKANWLFPEFSKESHCYVRSGCQNRGSYRH